MRDASAVQDQKGQDPNVQSSTAVQETHTLVSIENSSVLEFSAEIEANKEQKATTSQREEQVGRLFNSSHVINESLITDDSSDNKVEHQETTRDCSTLLGGSGEEETDVSVLNIISQPINMNEVLPSSSKLVLVAGQKKKWPRTILPAGLYTVGRLTVFQLAGHLTIGMISLDDLVKENKILFIVGDWTFANNQSPTISKDHKGAKKKFFTPRVPKIANPLKKYKILYKLMCRVFCWLKKGKKCVFSGLNRDKMVRHRNTNLTNLLKIT
ncbi:hypothetical protein BpHYR1_054405 [Brachionus plicatilis]|uniref:Uncharacterized protein n=1 Tax=Brachionus plicatilis TaxID=10195 RepID=A0A3M7PXT7_BRAPC|nr:hypothetical protein BpHYR1_054405 [Brachionus plicatilis]